MFYTSHKGAYISQDRAMNLADSEDDEYGLKDLELDVDLGPGHRLKVFDERWQLGLCRLRIHMHMHVHEGDVR